MADEIPESDLRIGFDHSQPEILPTDCLIRHLKERCPHLGDLSSLNHASLVELFYKNIAPLPQRQYQPNRRGQRMMKKRTMRENRKRKHDEITFSNEPNKSSPGETGLITKLSRTQVCDRLKPAPSATNPERKIVKLGKSSSLTHTHISSPISSSNSGTRVANETDLSNIVINSKPRIKSTGLDDTQTKSMNLNAEAMDTTPAKVGKSMVDRNLVTVARTKLKRTSAVSIHSVMDVSQLLPRQLQTNRAEMQISHKETNNSESSSENVNSVNGDQGKTPKGDAKDSSPTGETKKTFTRVAVKWP